MSIINPYLPPELNNKGGSGYIITAIPVFIGLAFTVATLLFVAMLFVGGIRWITSAGDKEGITAAKGTLVNAIAGIIITFSIFAILKVIETIFGINILAIDIGPLKIQ